MAGELSKEELAGVLMHVMVAAKILRPQLDRLLQIQRQLRRGDDDIAAGLRANGEHTFPAFAAKFAAMLLDVAVTVTVTAKHCDLACELSKVYYLGIEAGARHLATCLDLPERRGVCLALEPPFAGMPDEHLFDALVAQRLPTRPTTMTETEAFSRVEAAFYALKLCKEHHIPTCIEHLVGIRPRPVKDVLEGEDNQDGAATERAAKITLSEPAPVAAAAAATAETPQPPARRTIDHDKARTYLDRACTLVSLAINHIDLAVAAISTSLDPKEVASISEFTDREAHISESHFLQVTTF